MRAPLRGRRGRLSHPRRGLLASSLDLRCTRKSALDLPPGKATLGTPVLRLLRPLPALRRPPPPASPTPPHRLGPPRLAPPRRGSPFVASLHPIRRERISPTVH